MSATTTQSSTSHRVVSTIRDICLWRRKKLTATALFVSTATWVLLNLYQFNFISVTSWVAVSIVASLFIWGNILRLLGKEPPNPAELEIPGQTGMETANYCRELIEEAIRWMFRVAVEGDLFTVAGVIAGLLALSYLGSFFDLLTLLYMGSVSGITVPVVYVKFEDNIRRLGERVKVQGRSFYEMIDEKMIQRMKNKVVNHEEKEKKTE